MNCASQKDVRSYTRIESKYVSSFSNIWVRNNNGHLQIALSLPRHGSVFSKIQLCPLNFMHRIMGIGYFILFSVTMLLPHR